MKSVVKSIAKSIFKDQALSEWHAKSKTKLFCPFYHVVSNDDLAHIKHLYPYKSVRQFESDLEIFLKHYKPISYNDLLAGQREGMLLSFDDGLKECFEIIAPILFKKGVQAIFFVNSAFVSNRDLMYRYKASLLIDRIGQKDKLLAISYEDQQMLDSLAEDNGVSFEQFLINKKPYMDESQISQLIEKGFTIGAHSIDHPFYANLGLEDQLNQTLECVNYLKKTFDLSQVPFAFPFSDHRVSPEFYSEIRKNGVHHSFGTAGIKRTKIDGHFQRIPMEQEVSDTEVYLKQEYAYRRLWP